MAMKKHEETYVDDGIFRDSVPRATTVDDWNEMLAALARPYTETEWLAELSAFVDAQFAPELLYEASQKPDATPVMRDLMEVKRLLAAITQTVQTTPGKYSFTDVLHTFWLGCAYQRILVRPKAPLVKKHKRQMATLADARAKRGMDADDHRRECQDEMKKLKRQTRGSNVSHTELQRRTAKIVDLSLRTVKRYTPKEKSRDK